MRQFSNLALLGIALLLCLITTPRVSGYAAWLQCYVEFDPEEVVMNYRIVSNEDAEHDVRILVKNADDPSSEWSSSFPSTGVSHTTTTTLWVKLQFPETMEYQDKTEWVIEASPSEAAVEFLGVGRMCEGKRNFSSGDRHAILKVTSSSEPTTIRLVATYAAGFEAVSLTPALELHIPSENGARCSPASAVTM